MVALLVGLVMLLPWCGAIIVLLVGDKRPDRQHFFAVCAALAGAVCAIVLLPLTSSDVVLSIATGGFLGDLTFIPDALGVLLAAIAQVVGGLAVLFSVDYMHGESGLGRYYALVLLFIGAMCGLVLTGSLLLMFLFWELVALCSYALISFHNDDPKAVVGGIKALIITQLGGIGLLIGVLLAGATLGDYQIGTLLSKSATLPAGTIALVAFGFLFAAIAKSAQVPLHTWLPDAMEAPTPVSALIHAATMVNAGVYLLARFYPAFAPVPGWTTAVIVVGALSALLGGLMALVAFDLKRALAYSTISQLGYMVYAVGVGGVFASQFHLFSHAIFKALLFLSAGAIIHTLGTRDMREMGGLWRRMPFVYVTFGIGALALIGVPILNGFWSKELILDVGMNAGPGWAYLVMLVGVGLTALYAFRMVWWVFYGAPRRPEGVYPAYSAMRFVLTILALGVLVTWLFAGPISELFAQTLPFHELHASTTLEIITEVRIAPMLPIALAVIGLGLIAWGWRLRTKSTGVFRLLAVPGQALANGLGFEWVNRLVIRSAKGIAELMRLSQTGQVNWNIAGIVGGLILILVLLAGVSR